MFYVMLKTKKGKWGKTMYGAKRSKVKPYNFSGVTSENFKGIPFKFEAETALRCARMDHPKETYRLIYSEEEL